MSEELTNIPEGAESYTAPNDDLDSIESEKQAEVINKLEAIVESSENLAIVTDLDGTVLPFAKDPRDCKINPVARESLERMKEKGVPIIVMTGRSGQDDAKMIGIPGAIIIGTAGWEVFRDGVSHVHEKFESHSEDIARLISSVRLAVYESIGIDHGEVDQTELTNSFESGDGTVVMERKAVNEMHPEGISCIFNLNQVGPEKRQAMIDSARKAFEESISEDLKSMFVFEPDESFDVSSDNCSITISPYGGEGKEKSLIQLLRSDEDVHGVTGERKRRQYFEGTPGGFDGVVFFGDSNQDAKALRAAHLSATMAGRNSLGVLIVKVGEESTQEIASKNADASVDGIDGNASLLSKFASIVEEKYKAD